MQLGTIVLWADPLQIDPSTGIKKRHWDLSDVQTLDELLPSQLERFMEGSDDIAFRPKNSGVEPKWLQYKAVSRSNTSRCAAWLERVGRVNNITGYVNGWCQQLRWISWGSQAIRHSTTNPCIFWVPSRWNGQNPKLPHRSLTFWTWVESCNWVNPRSLILVLNVYMLGIVGMITIFGQSHLGADSFCYCSWSGSRPDLSRNPSGKWWIERPWDGRHVAYWGNMRTFPCKSPLLVGQTSLGQGVKDLSRVYFRARFHPFLWSSRAKLMP